MKYEPSQEFRVGCCRAELERERERVKAELIGTTGQSQDQVDDSDCFIRPDSEERPVVTASFIWIGFNEIGCEDGGQANA